MLLFSAGQQAAAGKEEPYGAEYSHAPKGGKAVRTILEWTEEIVLAVVLIAVVFTFVCRVVTVTGTSMVPSFHEGDRVLVVNDFNGVEQGDVVVIVNVLEEPIIKRVIATEGQTVDFDYEAGVVYVDGQPVDETQFGLENGITSEPFSSFELLEFPRPCPRAACLSWGTTGLSPRTAATRTWA